MANYDILRPWNGNFTEYGESPIDEIGIRLREYFPEMTENIREDMIERALERDSQLNRDERNTIWTLYAEYYEPQAFCDCCGRPFD